LIVGGNIAGYMRIMTTAIVLKTSEDELELALCRFQQPVERDPQAPRQIPAGRLTENFTVGLVALRCGCSVNSTG
jgi:hypothetical protein